MILKKWPHTKRLILSLMALGLTVFLFSCLKAGDGVGLDGNGMIIPPPDPCIANPAGPTCPVIDPCIANPSGPGCPVVDLCKSANPPDTCPVAVDSCAREAGSLVRKPVGCLDMAYYKANVLPIWVAKCPLCHSKVPPGTGYSATGGVANGLSLEEVDGWDSLVNKVSFDYNFFKKKTLYRVVPGLPDSSFLYWKITMDEPIPQQATRMPFQLPPLTDAEILIIKTWIIGRN